MTTTNSSGSPRPLSLLAGLILLGLAACATPRAGETDSPRTRGEATSASAADLEALEPLDALLDLLMGLGLPPDARIADLTPLEGTLAFYLAESCPRATVYAVETDLARLGELRRQLLETPVLNLVLTLGSPHRTHLPPAEVDLVLLRSDVARFRSPERALLELATRFGTRGGLLVLLREPSAHPDAPHDDPERAGHSLIGPLRATGYSLHDIHTLGPRQVCEIWSMEPGS